LTNCSPSGAQKPSTRTPSSWRPYSTPVNLAEVFSRVADRGEDPAKLAAELTQSGLLDGAITVEPFTAADAIDAGRLRPLTRDAGLSLGDRACLALARRLDAPALTADTDWQGVPPVAHGVELRPIR
jgi:ribonuclease VapC